MRGGHPTTVASVGAVVLNARMDEQRERSWWGWGFEDAVLSDDRTARLAEETARRFEVPDLQVRPVPTIADLELRAPRLEAPSALAGICTTDAAERARHTLGMALRDVARCLAGELVEPPDVVAYPTDEAQVVDVLDWCAAEEVAVVPYGGGTSVVGGTEYRGETSERWVSLDLSRMDRVLEVDETSRTARIQGGASGPALEAALRPHGLTMRHFPQSFELATLGGMLATRSGGHFATGPTHIDELAESLRVLTPSGVSESRRLPGSGAGPSPDRLFLGSEGTLGVITEAWMRLQQRPTHKASTSVHFTRFVDAVDACRLVAQSGLQPANCRLLDPGEAVQAGVTDGSTVLLLGFESADHPVDAWMTRAVGIAEEHGGSLPGGVANSADDGAARAGRGGAAGAWRCAFFEAPYVRDAALRFGGLFETFETACTWDRFGEFHDGVMRVTRSAVADVCGKGEVSCRFTHVYPDGPAPYYTIRTVGGVGLDAVRRWDEMKARVSEAIIDLGGTITHHHAIGRDHAPWYRRQRPEPFGAALAAAKSALDPQRLLNPGVLGL